jgi:YbbR domain-containing protein
VKGFLWRSISEDLPLKLVSLALAMTLFVLVRTDKDAVTGAFVKVVYTIPEDRVLVSDPPTEVRVGIRGPWSRVNHFDERDVEPIQIDLANHVDPTVHFDEDMVRLPIGLRVASITPSEVKLKYEPKEVREVIVQPLLEGEPAEGFRVTKVTARPGKVRIEGAKSAIESVRRVNTRPLRVADATGLVREAVPLEPAPHHTHYLDGASVVAEAEIRPAIVERVLDGVTVNVTAGTRLEAAVEPTAVQVILRGPSDLVRQVPPDAIGLGIDARLEDARPPALYKKRVLVTGLPTGVAAEVRPDTVMLSTRRRRD